MCDCPVGKYGCLGQVLFSYGLSKSSVDSILRSLFVALERYRYQQSASPSSLSGEEAGDNLDEIAVKVEDIKKDYLNAITEEDSLEPVAPEPSSPAKKDRAPQPLPQQKKRLSKKKKMKMIHSSSSSIAQQRCE